MSCSGDSIQTEYDGSKARPPDNVGAGQTWGQSFKIPTDATICAASIYGGRGTVGARGNFRFEIATAWTGGSVLATTGDLPDSTFANDWTPTPAWNKIEFVTPVALTAGTQYYLRCKGLTGGVDVFRTTIENINAYSNGNLYIGTTSYPTWEMLFRIHGGTGGGGSPSPSPFAMFF